MNQTSKIIICTGLLLGCMVTANAQGKKPKMTARLNSKSDSAFAALGEPQKVITNGTVTVEGKSINYRAVAGTIILKNEKDQPTCSMFYAAYFKTGQSDESKRPVTFIYNGGPGYSTMLLHMAAWGPKTVYLDDTTRVKAPYKTVNNDYSLLDASDLVFIDAPGTGFSRIITKDKGGAGKPKDFYGIDEDAAAFTQFITDFLSAYDRWDSPKYLFGESYGTFRSAAVAYRLSVQKGVDLNGVILLSQLLSWSNMTDIAAANPGNDMSYELALPSFAATAWYHHKLPDRPDKLEPFLKQVEHFAMNDYALALNEGSTIDSVTFNRIARELHQYTGLPVGYIRKTNLRITGPEFEHTLLASNDMLTGRYDARFSGYAVDPLSKEPAYDPTDSHTNGPLTAAFNNYVRTVLKYGKGQHYRPVNYHIFSQWDFKHNGPGTPVNIFSNVMPDLAHAMIYNPNLKVMLNSGYFDLATPFYEGRYEMHHLPMPVSLQKNIEFHYYYSGHMVYLHPESHKKLHDNVAHFIESTH